MLFDTLKLSDVLQESFSPEQARTLAKALAGADADQLVTKSDLKGELTALENRLIKWIFTAIAFNFAATAGLIISLAKVFMK